MADSEAKRAWVTRVLGFAFGAGGQSGGGNAGLLKIWVSAKEEIDAAIGDLQKALKATGDRDLLQVAEYGLYGVGRGQNVQMMAALREMEAGTPAGPGKLADAMTGYREFLDGPVADLLENNAFDVPVPLRAVLGKALDTLAHNLS